MAAREAGPRCYPPTHSTYRAHPNLSILSTHCLTTYTVISHLQLGLPAIFCLCSSLVPFPKRLRLQPGKHDRPIRLARIDVCVVRLVLLHYQHHHRCPHIPRQLSQVKLTFMAPQLPGPTLAPSFTPTSIALFTSLPIPLASGVSLESSMISSRMLILRASFWVQRRARRVSLSCCGLGMRCDRIGPKELGRGDENVSY